MKKKTWLEEIWDYLFIFTLLQALVVPWDPIYNGNRPPRYQGHPALNLAGYINDPIGIDGEGTGGHMDGRRRGKEMRPVGWGRRALDGIVRVLYPRDGLVTYALTDVLPNPNQASAVDQRYQQPSTSTGGQEELSIEDSDLIDVLWRQDIDMEKGFNVELPTPERQHEQDLQLLTEKHFEQFERGPWNMNGRRKMYNTMTKEYEELKSCQKNYADENPFLELTATNGKWEPGSFCRRQNGELVEDDDEVFDIAKCLANEECGRTLYEQLPVLEQSNVENLENSENLDENFVLEFLQSEMSQRDNSQLVNDVCLSSTAQLVNDSTQLLNESTQITPPADSVENFLGGGLDFGLGFGPMDFNNREVAAMPRTNMGLYENVELDDLPTPSLNMTPSDVARLFADRQVTEDIATSLQDQATGYDPSGGEYLRRRRERQSSRYDQQVPSFSDYAMEEGQSEVGIETYPPFGDYEYSNMIPGKELPSTDPISPRLRYPSRGPSSSPASSHIDHDHGYLASSPDMEVWEGAVGGVRHDENDGIDRAIGKLVPSLGLMDGKREIEEEDLEEEFTVEEECGSEYEHSSTSEDQQRGLTGRRSQDEQLALAYDLPYTALQISTMPLHEFQRITKSKHLTTEQIDVIKKIRRRGKNKVAAQNCRKRKVENLDQLDMETSLLSQERRVEMELNKRLQDEIAKEREEIQRLERELN